jgi:hypothetical protein
MTPREYWTADPACLDAYFDRQEALEDLGKATEADDGVAEALERFDATDEAFDIALVTFWGGLTWADRVRLNMDVGEDTAARVTVVPANDNVAGNWISAADLLTMEFEPVRYVVPGFIAEGLTILGGRPKLGKSWLALDFAIGVASGGVSLGERCEQGAALYLALEDNQRRLQDRMKTVLPKLKSAWPDLSALGLRTDAPKVNAGLIAQLDQWRRSVTNPRLIIIDTLAMVRPPKKGNQDSYSADYEVLSPLQKFAGEHRLAIVVVTHVRKMEASDPLEMISGTNGLTGAADSIMVLDRTSDGPKLYGRGRDIEEVEKALKFDGGKWSVLGDLEEVKRSDQRREILAVMKEDGLPMKPAEIAKAVGSPVANVNYLLRKMVEAGEVDKVAYGSYRLASESSYPSELFDSEDS